MFTTIFSVFSTIASITGVVAFFSANWTLLFVCAGISILNSIIQVIWGGQNNLSTEIGTCIIFLIISFFVETSWYTMITFGLCVVEALLGTLGTIGLIIAFFTTGRNNYWR